MNIIFSPCYSTPFVLYGILISYYFLLFNFLWLAILIFCAFASLRCYWFWGLSTFLVSIFIVKYGNMELKLKIIQFRRTPPPGVFHLLNYWLTLASTHVLLDWITAVCARARLIIIKVSLWVPDQRLPYIYFLDKTIWLPFSHIQLGY